jgi:hypothetical protein
MPRILISDCFYAEKAPKSFILLHICEKILFPSVLTSELILGLSNAIFEFFEVFELCFAAFMPRILISDCFHAEKAPKSFILLEFLKKMFFSLF